MDILCYLLVGAPANVCMPPGAFINGDASVLACREAAQVCQIAHRQRMVGRQPGAARPLYEFVDQLSGPRYGGNSQDPVEEYERLGPNETQAQRDQEILELLQKHLSAKAYSPSCLPNAAWSGLRRLLPRGGLAPFLKRHADNFDIRFDDHGKVAAFRLFRVDPPPGLSSAWRRAGTWPASGSQGPAGNGDGNDMPTTSDSQVQGPREREMVAFAFKDKLYLGKVGDIGDDGQAHVDFGFYGTWLLAMESLWTCGESPFHAGARTGGWRSTLRIQASSGGAWASAKASIGMAYYASLVLSGGQPLSRIPTERQTGGGYGRARLTTSNRWCRRPSRGQPVAARTIACGHRQL